MESSVKFLFDNDFEKNMSQEDGLTEELRLAFAQELSEAKEQAFEEGRQSGEQEAQACIEQHISECLQDFLTQSVDARKMFEERLATIHRDALELALGAAIKLSNGLIKEDPNEVIERLFCDLIGEVRSEPQLVIRVANELAEALQERLAPHISEHGFTGKLIVIGEEDFAPGAGRIEWANGGISYSIEAVETEVQQAVDRYLDKLADVDGRERDEKDVAPHPVENAGEGDATPDEISEKSENGTSGEDPSDPLKADEEKIMTDRSGE